MDFSFFSGPDKTPFEFDENGVVGENTTTPFHGIVSKGLLNKLILNNVPNNVWYNNAHLLEKDGDHSNSDLQELFIIKEYATECKALSFSQSALCAKMYLEDYFKDQDVKECEVWNIKEGHSSSVWKVTFCSMGMNESFAVNVARDEEACTALKEGAKKMKKISDRCPEINLAKILDIYVLQHPSLPSQVVITRNEWINNSYEINSRKNKLTGKDELLMVERFITNMNSPTQITSVLGRLCTTEEVKTVQNGIEEFTTKATAYLQEQPDININYGDVVWDGKKAVVVALN